MKPSSPATALTAENMLKIELVGIRLIEASAGTGKTYTIANLYLRHILEGRSTAEILVVTYTNAATDELRDRIQQRLLEAHQLFTASSDCDDEFLSLLLRQFQSLQAGCQKTQLKRLVLALRSMDEARISTIHSFCQRALLDFAIAGNQYFDSRLLTNDEHLWQQAIKDWWRRQTYLLDPSGWYLFDNHADNLNRLISNQRLLRNKPAAELLCAGEQSLSSLLEAWKEFTDEIAALQQAWRQHRPEISRILHESTALTRAKTIPYHFDKLPGFIDMIDSFFSLETNYKLPKTLHYLGAETLQKKSKKNGCDTNLTQPFFQSVDTALAAYKNILPVIAQVKSRVLFEAHRDCSRRVLETKKQSRTLAYQDLLTELLNALQSASGDRLCIDLRQRFPVAMIDEFQDTDAIQYRIFERLYFSEKSLSLSLIGDPKQAIYGFRGGDVFTYMRVRQMPGIKHYCLQTNWRSQASVVDAINAIFMRRPQPFIYSDAIEFNPASAAAINQHQFLQRQNEESPGLSLWVLEHSDDAESVNQTLLLDRINQAVADEIVQLLTPGNACIAGKPVVSGDIAILVRSSFQGQLLEKVLNTRGLRSVTIGKAKVFGSDEARGLQDLLQAIVHQSSQAMAKRSLASNLFYFDYLEIAALTDDEQAWRDWSEKLYRLNQRWSNHGFIAMFQQLLQDFQIAQRLAKRQYAERRLTNLLHLGELLHQQAAQRAGMESLLGWFQAQLDDDGNEEAELRLESDEALIKIVTIHKSKGLQYPCVFVPYLWTCNTSAKSGPLGFHDNEFNARFDLGSDEYNSNRLRAEKERLAEDVRLLYVALTRAQSKAYLVWGPVPGAAPTALAYLLHSQQSATHLEQQPADGFPTAMDFSADMRALAEAGGGNIEISTLPTPVSTSPICSDVSANQLVAPGKFTGKAGSEWRISSFTGLTRDVHQIAHLGETGSQGDAILDFPAGSHVGLLIHSILEHLDFQQDISIQCEPLIRRYASRFGLGSDSYQKILVQWMQQVLESELNKQGLKLSKISNACRLNELSFDFAFDQLDIAGLNQLMETHSGSSVEPISAQNFRGLITGIIDLVFLFEGKYYLADYKSNHLGSSLEDYLPERLNQAMCDRRYDLQSMIYTLALHRYLAQRIPGYQYQQHFGGSFYLFLRAMRANSAQSNGVYFERVDEGMIEALDSLFSFDNKVENA